MKVRSPAARAAWIATVLVLPLYSATMNRTVGFIDRGELAAVAATFGIAHPTGYPTLTLLAGALVHVVPLPPVLVLNALAAALTAAGAGVMALLLDRVLAEVRAPMTPPLRASYALLGALFTALTMTWWGQANGFEVYALHALLMPLVVLLFLRWSDRAAEDPPRARSAATLRAGVAFALVTGLSFTNHLTTVLLAPGLLAAAMMRFGVGRRFWSRILPLAPPFALGLLPYAWLPIRSSMNPRFDWGHVRSLQAFLHHVTGADYQRWMFSDAGNVLLQLRYLLWRLPLDFAFVGIVLAGIGVWLLARRAPRLAVLSAVLVVAGAGFAAGYGIPDLDAYLLTAVLGIALSVAGGLVALHERFGPRVALPVVASLVLLNGGLHFRDCDERGNRMVEDFVHDCIGPLPHGAVLFTDMWENLVSGSEYVQEVEGFRRDVVIVSPSLARESWYLDELEHRQPELVARAGPAFGDYRTALRTAESGGSGTRAGLEAGRRDFLDALVAGCIADRPVFSTGALPSSRRSWHPVPWRLVMWIRSDSSYVPEEPWTWSFHPWSGHMDVYAAQTYYAYARARFVRARYEAAHRHLERARRLIAEARSFDPHIHPERVGPQPLGLDRIVLATADYFRTLNATDPLALR